MVNLAIIVQLFLGLWHFSSRSDPRDPCVSPIYAEGLFGLPSPLIIAAEYDTSRDEAEAYAEQFESASPSSPAIPPAMGWCTVFCRCAASFRTHNSQPRKSHEPCCNGAQPSQNWWPSAVDLAAIPIQRRVFWRCCRNEW